MDFFAEEPPIPAGQPAESLSEYTAGCRSVKKTTKINLAEKESGLRGTKEKHTSIRRLLSLPLFLFLLFLVAKILQAEKEMASTGGTIRYGKQSKGVYTQFL